MRVNTKRVPVWEHRLGGVNVVAHTVNPDAYSVSFEEHGKRYRVCIIDHNGQVSYGPLTEAYHTLRDSRGFKKILEKFSKFMEIHLIMVS